MESISNILSKDIKKSSTRSERADIIGQLYEYYTSPHERSLRKKTPIKELSIQRFCIKLSHLKVDSLYYLLSQAKDIQHRGGSFSGYILNSIKIK